MKPSSSISTAHPRCQILIAVAICCALAACGDATSSNGSNTPNHNTTKDQGTSQSGGQNQSGSNTTKDQTGPTGDQTAINWLPVADPPDHIPERIAENAHISGMWSDVINWPINAIHMVTLPNGKVLTYGTRQSDQRGTGNLDGGTNVLWDPYLGFGDNAFTINTFATDPKRQLNSFCSSATLLANGNVLSTGGYGGNYGRARDGSSSLFSGEYSAQTNVTEHITQTADERWYSTMLTLPDGRPIVLGGMVPYAENAWNNKNSRNGLASTTPEVFNPATKQWEYLQGASSDELFSQYLTRSEAPRAWVTPNGELFGISSDRLWFMNPTGNGSIRDVGEFKGEARGFSGQDDGNHAALPNVGSATSTAVMFAPGRVLQAGGNGYWFLHNRPASSAATVFDIRDGQVTFQDTNPMNFPRRYLNSTVLPDGQVFVNGGTRKGVSGRQAVLEGEMWNPATGQWTVMAAQNRARVYHNSAALLASGVVLSSGGGNPGPVFNRNSEVFFPPYLFTQVNGVTQAAPRPRITGVDRLQVTHGGTLNVRLQDPRIDVREVVMMGMSVTTHSFNASQRRIPVSYTRSSNGERLQVSVPNANLLPPGYYMAVVINRAGVPSKGVIVAVGNSVSAPTIEAHQRSASADASTRAPYTPSSCDEERCARREEREARREARREEREARRAEKDEGTDEERDLTEEDLARE